MATGQFYLEHRSCEDCRDGSLDLHRLLFCVFIDFFWDTGAALLVTTSSAATSSKISWSCDSAGWVGEPSSARGDYDFEEPETQRKKQTLVFLLETP